jgi:AcrR family transcriptional regulator
MSTATHRADPFGGGAAALTTAPSSRRGRRSSLEPSRRVSETITINERRRGGHAARRASTRAKILAAAIDCLNAAGYAETSTVRVAAEAKVARGSLLHQFPTRVDLILAVADHAAKTQGEFIAAALAEYPPGRERYIGSVDATWTALQRPESRALLEIIIATRHDPELAARIADFAERFDAGVGRGARRLAEASGLRDERNGAVEERRFMLAALRGLAIEAMLSGPSAASPEPALARLRQSRARFFDAHFNPAGTTP